MTPLNLSADYLRLIVSDCPSLVVRLWLLAFGCLTKQRRLIVEAALQ